MSGSNEVAVIVGGGPGVSASCARLFAAEGMQVAIAARTPSKPVLAQLREECDARPFECDATDPSSVDRLFSAVESEFGTPSLVVHNIDGRTRGIFRKSITEADPELAKATLINSAFSAFIVGQRAAQSMLARDLPENGQRGTILFTNASAAFKGYPLSLIHI